MNIETQKAADLFFPNPSLQSVYFEAIANSFDANASVISININLPDFSDVNTFTLDIIDNGEGFTEDSFDRFTNLLKTKSGKNKGIGRLVFLKYFDTVDIQSTYDDITRSFQFSWDYDGTSSLSKSQRSVQKTVLHFRGYNKSKIREYSYVTPSEIKEAIIRNFLPLLYRFKKEGRDFEISISLITKTPNPTNGFVDSTYKISNSTIPELIEKSIDSSLIDLISTFTLSYSIRKTYEPTSIITAICVDERTIPVQLFTKKSLPDGYELIFIMYSDFFNGRVNTARDTLDLDDDALKRIKTIFISIASELINNGIPGVKERNAEINTDLENKFPHLQGYFDSETIGLIEKDKSLEIAQKKFLKDQKAILEAEDIDDVQYEKSLDISSRVLAEYIVYRSVIINKLKTMDPYKNESIIHDLIVPRKKIYKRDSFIETIFSNNAWLLDDKYMTYTTILSDKQIKEIYKELHINDSTNRDDDRPDITVIFSRNPEEDIRTDVVIVELKKLGLDLARKEELVSQLKQRARILLKYFPDKIQRFWFYGIVDIDSEFRISLLEEEYVELFSSGSIFYKEHSVLIEENKLRIPIGLFVQSYNSFLEDAEARNLTFLNILKEGLREQL